MGVDLNRNYRVASGFDGYDGASTSCISDTYQGPPKLSEPESRNTIWLVERNPNIKFFMSVHSNGGQLFWQPGAYIAEGRITTPRPPLGDEAYYWQSAEPDPLAGQGAPADRGHARERGRLVGRPVLLRRQRPRGPVPHLRHLRLRVEVGGSVYNPATGDFQAGSFQPAWAAATALQSPSRQWCCRGG